MPKKFGPIRGLTGTSFLDNAESYLSNPNYRKKLIRVCEKYGISPQLEPGKEHIQMWAEIGAALAEEHEGFAKQPRGRRKGTAGKPERDEFKSDADVVMFFEQCAQEWGLSFDEVIKKGVEWAEDSVKIEYPLDPRVNLKRLKRVKAQLDKERQPPDSTSSLLSGGLLSGRVEVDKKEN